jgi:hypothetical protein
MVELYSTVMVTFHVVRRVHLLSLVLMRCPGSLSMNVIELLGIKYLKISLLSLYHAPFNSHNVSSLSSLSP